MVGFNRIVPKDTGKPCDHEAWMVAVGDLADGIVFAGPFRDSEDAGEYATQAEETFGVDVTVYQLTCPACFLYGTPEEENDDAISGE